MAKYIKRSIVVQAWQVQPAFQDGELAQAVVDGKIRYCEDGSVLIATPEGTMQAFPGDWIILDNQGEYYPCVARREYEALTLALRPVILSPYSA